MKKLLFIAAIAATMFSCNTDMHTVILPNGAKVEARDVSRTIQYGAGNTVCIMKTNGSGWTICTDGEMVDTSYIRSYNEDGKTGAYRVIHKIGKISVR